MSLKNRIISGALLVGASMFGGCAAHSFKEVSREPGKAVFQGERTGLAGVGPLELSVCNEATVVGYEGLFKNIPMIDYLGLKDTFVEGEPLKFVIYWHARDYSTDQKCLVDLVKNGEVDPTKRRLLDMPGNAHYWLKMVPYNDLSSGNYTLTCSKEKEFMGKVDFQVVSPPDRVTDNKR
jgi:hypothetical protein